jgi:hypothetical protein
MRLTPLELLAGSAAIGFVAATWAIARFIGKLVAGNNVDEGHPDALDAVFPAERRSLHYIRQGVTGVLVALAIGDGLLGAILVVLLAGGLSR